jgi:hypothetical protein
VKLTLYSMDIQYASLKLYMINLSIILVLYNVWVRYLVYTHSTYTRVHPSE